MIGCVCGRAVDVADERLTTTYTILTTRHTKQPGRFDDDGRRRYQEERRRQQQRCRRHPGAQAAPAAPRLHHGANPAAAAEVRNVELGWRWVEVGRGRGGVFAECASGDQGERVGACVDFV